MAVSPWEQRTIRPASWTMSEELRLACASLETASAAHYYLGWAALQTDNFEVAARELEAALQANPGNLDAAAELGLVRLRTKNYRLAEQGLMKVLNEYPDHYKETDNCRTSTNEHGTLERRTGAKSLNKSRSASDREQSLLRRVEFIK